MLQYECEVVVILKFSFFKVKVIVTFPLQLQFKHSSRSLINRKVILLEYSNPIISILSPLDLWIYIYIKSITFGHVSIHYSKLTRLEKFPIVYDRLCFYRTPFLIFHISFIWTSKSNLESSNLKGSFHIQDAHHNIQIDSAKQRILA